MKRIKNSKFLFVSLIAVSVLLVITLTGVLYAYSKNTTFFGLFGSDNINGARVASYDVIVDGVADNRVDFKAYATTKVSDITNTGDTYKGNSFREDAYQKHTITVTNNSEVTVKCDMTMTKTTNDDRVFSAVLEGADTESKLLSVLYNNMSGHTSTMADMRTALADLSRANKYTVLKTGETKTFTFIIWSEHDAVYPDSDNDGVADEDGKKLSELTDGVPQETYHLDYRFNQLD